MIDGEAAHLSAVRIVRIVVWVSVGLVSHWRS